MKLKQKIYKAIDKMDEGVNRQPYEDDYDGFTHYTYAGLVEQVQEELFNEGYEEDAPQSIVDDKVFDLF